MAYRYIFCSVFSLKKSVFIYGNILLKPLGFQMIGSKTLEFGKFSKHNNSTRKIYNNA